MSWGLGEGDGLFVMSKEQPGAQLSSKELKALKKQQKQAKRAAQKGGQPGGGGSGAPCGGSAGAARDDPRPSIMGPSLFDHIEEPKPVVSSKDVHPAILHLALQMKSCKIIGSSLRCKAMMEAFEQVIADYSTPPNSTLSRSLAVHLSTQIEILKSGRPLSVSMGNAIRWLKQQTSTLGIDLSEADAKARLIQAIRLFVKEQIDVADRIIVKNATASIKDGDVIMTYGHSSVVSQTFAHAKALGLEFRVICVDSRPLFEGKRLAAELVSLGIPTQYILITALPYVLGDVTTLMVGAHAMVSNGNVYSRVGTSVVAMCARTRNIPMLVLCETLKFTYRLQLDAFSVNERMPTEDGNPNYVFYDLTDQHYISKVITEVGALPASSVHVILREYKSLIQ